jgi:hypothetical protein
MSTSNYVHEHALIDLVGSLDDAAGIIGEACECDPSDLQRDDLVQAIAAINRAADFIQETLEQHIERRQTWPARVRNGAA